MCGCEFHECTWCRAHAKWLEEEDPFRKRTEQGFSVVHFFPPSDAKISSSSDKTASTRLLFFSSQLFFIFPLFGSRRSWQSLPAFIQDWEDIDWLFRPTDSTSDWSLARWMHKASVFKHTFIERDINDLISVLLTFIVKDLNAVNYQFMKAVSYSGTLLLKASKCFRCNQLTHRVSF